MVGKFVLLTLVGVAILPVDGQPADNTLYLSFVDHRFTSLATYIAWFPANPELYGNRSEIPFTGISYASLNHHWTSMAVDFHAGNVSFHDKENHWIYLSDDFETPDGGYAHPIEGGTSGVVEAMTIDWLAQNVYWVDEGYNWIKMTNYTGGGEAIIADTGLERPYGISCHPSKGYLFWTELGDRYPPKIERSSMTGANRVTIVTDLSEPRSIAVDTTTNRIYWTDNSKTESKIESSDLDGNDRRVEVLQPTSLGVFDSISVDEEYIFVSVFGTEDIEDILRYYSKIIPNELVYEHNFGTAIRVLDVCVAGPNIQSKPTELPCDGNTCDHYCVSKAGNSYECLCRDKYILYPNGTCSVDLTIQHPPFCVIGRTDALSLFDPSLLHYDLDNKHNYIHNLFGELVRRDVTALTVDVHSNLMFFADDITKSIYLVRMVEGQYPVSIHSYEEGRIEGMAVDWLSLTIYWVDYRQGSLAFSSYDGRNSDVLFHDVTEPTSMAIDPNARLIFWTEATSPAKLVRCDLDGKNRRVLVNTNLQNPKGITLDHGQQRVYLVGDDSTFIYFIDYYGTTLEILGKSQYPANDITIYQDFLLLAESYGSNKGLVEAVHKMTGEHEGRLDLNNSVSAIGIADESAQPLPTTVPTTIVTRPPTVEVPTTIVTRPPTVEVPTTIVTRPPTVEDDTNLALIIGVVAGSAGIVIIIVIIIALLINHSSRSKRTGATHEPFSHDPVSPGIPQIVNDNGQRPLQPPTYESSISIDNQAAGGASYPTKHDNVTPDTVAFYTKEELANQADFNNPIYMHIIDPPRYAPYPDNSENSDYVDLNINSMAVPSVASPSNLTTIGSSEYM